MQWVKVRIMSDFYNISMLVSFMCLVIRGKFSAFQVNLDLEKATICFKNLTKNCRRNSERDRNSEKDKHQTIL